MSNFDLMAGQGFFDVRIRPVPYAPDRLHGGNLESFLARNVVRKRGWPVPYIDQRESVARYDGWIGQEVDLPRHREAWRVFDSGLFLHRRVLVSDTKPLDELVATDPGATGAVVVWDVLLYMVEVAELAARWVTGLGLEEVVIEVDLRNVAGRQLVAGDFKRELHDSYIARAEKVGTQRQVGVSELLADPPQIGVDLTQRLLRRFGLDVQDQVLFDWQQQVFER